jgi:hypothetical protein
MILQPQLQNRWRISFLRNNGTQVQTLSLQAVSVSMDYVTRTAYCVIQQSLNGNEQNEILSLVDKNFHAVVETLDGQEKVTSKTILRSCTMISHYTALDYSTQAAQEHQMTFECVKIDVAHPTDAAVVDGYDSAMSVVE